MKKINSYNFFILIIIVFVLNTILFKSINSTFAQWKPLFRTSGLNVDINNDNDINVLDLVMMMESKTKVVEETKVVESKAKVVEETKVVESKIKVVEEIKVVDKTKIVEETKFIEKNTGGGSWGLKKVYSYDLDTKNTKKLEKKNITLEKQKMKTKLKTKI